MFLRNIVQRNTPIFIKYYEFSLSKHLVTQMFRYIEARASAAIAAKKSRDRFVRKLVTKGWRRPLGSLQKKFSDRSDHMGSSLKR